MTPTAKNRITALFVFLAALLLFGGCYGWGLLRHIGSNFFSSTSEDMLKDIYTTQYYVAYGHGGLQSTAMNYPYGEYHTYSGMQDQVAWPLWVAKQMGLPHPERAVVLLINLYIVACVCLTAVFLFLIFRWLSLPLWLSAVAGLCITFLIPQLQRMGGHLSLSYGCLVPMAIYFLMRHSQGQRVGWAIAFGATAWVAGIAHVYYFLFFATLAGVYLLWQLLLAWQKHTPSWRRWVVSAVFLLLLPTGLFYLCTHVGDAATDRAQVPWGFFEYRGRVEGLLFPYGRSYFRKPRFLPDVQWETWSYIGIVAVVCCAYLIGRGVASACRRQWHQVLHPTDVGVLNVCLLASLLLLAWACGVPWLWLPKNFICSIGPLAQIRAMGRLLWLFYFVINIISVYLLYRWHAAPGRRGPRMGLLVLALLLYVGECVAYNQPFRKNMRNEFPAWTDYRNQLPENEWVAALPAKEYQAILPLPLFNKGSEALSTEPHEGMFRAAALISMKTGLPLLSHVSARSSMQQAWEHLRLACQPIAPYPIHSGEQQLCQDGRPLLVACHPDTSLLNPHERNLLRMATELPLQAAGLQLYSLAPHQISLLYQQAQDSLLLRYRKATYVAEGDTVLRTLSEETAPGNASFCFRSFSELPQGYLEGIAYRTTVLYSGHPVPGNDSVEYILSFWLNHILEDQYARTSLHVTCTDTTGEEQTLFADIVARRVSAVALMPTFGGASPAGLVELHLTLPATYTLLHITLKNPTMPALPMQVDNLLLRPAGTPVAYRDETGQRFINNYPLL